MSQHDPVKIGIVSISDRASSGVYEERACQPCKSGWDVRCSILCALKPA